MSSSTFFANDFNYLKPVSKYIPDGKPYNVPVYCIMDQKGTR